MMSGQGIPVSNLMNVSSSGNTGGLRLGSSIERCKANNNMGVCTHNQITAGSKCTSKYCLICKEWLERTMRSMKL